MADRDASRSEKWINVAGVCRRWREVALVSPRLWCTIDIRQPTRALTPLARSKSAPLQIRGSTSETELMSTKADEELAKAVMEKIGCIQSLDLKGWQGENILRFLHLNAPTPAPSMLEHLQLVIKGRVVPPVSLPSDISQQVMPSLHHLELKNINICSDFLPLPHLRCLKFTSIQSAAIRSSTLLSLLQYSPELETIEVEGVDEENLSDCPRTQVQLRNLFNLSITSQKIAASAILGHLDFPPSADVTFLSERERTWNPDLSNLVEICVNHFAAHSAHSIDEVQVHGGERFQLSALRLETVSTLELDRLVEMPQTQWTKLFSAFKQVEDLRFAGFRVIRPSRALIKVLGNSALLPRLKAHLRKLLKERKHLEILVKVSFEFCSITAAAIGRLREFLEIDWDNSDIYMSYTYETEEKG
ncbi:hypothetical protein BDN71DRAFT_1511422 [Pleurotus eryngii]|uniref:F-box domain-containing protein n=1 Tax=Pleurotus eryngii TaxID=5323 RepID=A0A9P5ZL17_PLEER|nr:hypothetical protein BDN71DRAFT_1511422 [Pleurotus eryngii]